jgi:hypothetical protein
MARSKLKSAPATYALIVWMGINAVFMLLELTVFNDSADLNNSLLLVLWIVSMVGLLFSGKYGLAISAFALIYAFSFNAFNIIYFGSSIALLNGVSAVINAIAIIYVLNSLVQEKSAVSVTK